jgi:hypothetical protein
MLRCRGIAPTNPEALKGKIEYQLMRAKREDQRRCPERTQPPRAARRTL